MTTDLHFDSVSLLLHLDGADGSTAIVDSSASPKTVTAHGDAAITAAVGRFGGSCLSLGGTGYLLTQDDEGLALGTGDFTLEMWVKTTDVSATLIEPASVIEQLDGWWSLNFYSGRLAWSDYENINNLMEGAIPVNDGQWHHIAVTRSARTVRSFVDGAPDGEAEYWESDEADYAAPADLCFGVTRAGLPASYNFVGHLDELRITKGVARYTSAFAVPTEAFPGGGAPATEGFLAAAASPLGAPRALATASEYLCTALASAPSPLGRAVAKGLHDFTGLLGDASTRYVMDLITPAGRVRVPISSWQATLQTGSSNYVQCVVPACAPYAAQINSATEFVIYRRAELPDGSALEYEMARAPTGQVRFDRGPQRHTCTLAGYSTAFVADENPPAAYNRALVAVRSISSGQGGVRVRCAVDWLLRPGHRAFADGAPLVVSYINYYATSGGDGYMDVGERT